MCIVYKFIVLLMVFIIIVLNIYICSLLEDEYYNFKFLGGYFDNIRFYWK